MPIESDFVQGKRFGFGFLDSIVGGRFRRWGSEGGPEEADEKDGEASEDGGGEDVVVGEGIAALADEEESGDGEGHARENAPEMGTAEGGWAGEEPADEEEDEEEAPEGEDGEAVAGRDEELGGEAQGVDGLAVAEDGGGVFGWAHELELGGGDPDVDEVAHELGVDAEGLEHGGGDDGASVAVFVATGNGFGDGGEVVGVGPEVPVPFVGEFFVDEAFGGFGAVGGGPGGVFGGAEFGDPGLEGGGVGFDKGGGVEVAGDGDGESIEPRKADEKGEEEDEQQLERPAEEPAFAVEGGFHTGSCGGLRFILP